MKLAMESVQNGELNVTKAALLYGILRQTLKDKISGKYNNKNAGRTTELTAEEEIVLVNYIKYMASISQPLTTSAIKLFAWAISKRSNRKHSPFNEDFSPGAKWWWKFYKRHQKDITLRKPDTLDRGRSRMANIKVMNNHFAKLKEVLYEHKIFNKPKHIFNCDESGIRLDSQAGKVVVCRNTKQAYSEAKGSSTHITAHICCSASGVMLPPMLIFEKSFPSGDYSTRGPVDALYAKAPNSYMDGELFLAWMDKILIPSTSHIRPILLILDGHLSHITIDVIDLARAYDIVLYCLSPHTTKILQPLDVSIFRPIKQYFSKMCGYIQLATSWSSQKSSDQQNQLHGNI